MWATRALALGSVAAGALIGCASLDSLSDFSNDTEGPGEGDFGAPSAEFSDRGDAGNGAARGSQGNRLCYGLVGTECYPDQAETCPRDVGDAGAPDGEVDTPPSHGLACHVVPADGGAAPVCTAAGQGEDGSECIQSSDCGAGFECVGSPGQCRRYCCNGASSCAPEGRQFCDIQLRAEQGNKVPVCMPVRSCVLLGSGCTQGQTCAIVSEDGTTSCVGVGAAQAGDSCEEEHCAENLTCLGQAGMRRCYKLCQKSANMACSSEERCKGAAPLFKDPNIGICGKL